MAAEEKAAAELRLRAAYRRFLDEVDPKRKNEAGRDLIRAIFGEDSIAEDCREVQ